MKFTPLLIGVCLLSVTTGCQKPSDIVGRAEATIKTTALASITAKNPDLSSSELKFSGIQIHMMPNGQEDIFVDYDLPASSTTTTDSKYSTTSMKAIGVRMSPSGTVENVYEFTNTVINK